MVDRLGLNLLLCGFITLFTPGEIKSQVLMKEVQLENPDLVRWRTSHSTLRFASVKLAEGHIQFFGDGKLGLAS